MDKALAPLILAAIIALFCFRSEPERWHWCVLLWVLDLIAALAVMSGKNAAIAGAGFPIFVPVIYFSIKHRPQFALGDALAFILFFGCIISAAAAQFNNS